MYTDNYNIPKNCYRRLSDLIKSKGLTYLCKKLFYVYCNYLPAWFFLKNRYLLFGNRKIVYFLHPNNYTWSNERIIEIPLLLSLMEGYETGEILEVGNVLSHYLKTGWTIVDKYEHGVGVVNDDIAGFQPQKRYKLIISISTLEHVGFDEILRDDGKILRTIENLKENCLSQGGKIIFTLPFGVNSNLDDMILRDAIGYSEVYYFTRISWYNKWKISGKEEVFNTRYANPGLGANGLILGIVSK